MDGFTLEVSGREVELPVHAQRVLAFLALRDGAQPRQRVAERLWLDVPRERALASLRTALWRIRRACTDLVRCPGGRLALGQQVDVDAHRLVAEAGQLVRDASGISLAQIRMRPLEAELLPDWDEDWLLFERERLHQMCIHALEALSRRLVDVGQFAHAIEAAQAAIAAEPLRESAHLALIDAYLAEGNMIEAQRDVEKFAAMLWDELGSEPSTRLVERFEQPLRDSGYETSIESPPTQQWRKLVNSTGSTSPDGASSANGNDS
jgi:DNA-binding SARP family transcriptional activator